MKAAAIIVLALAALAGCGSTVLLGSLDGSFSTDMAPGIDISIFPSFDIAQAVPPDGFDLGIVDLGTDATVPVDLAQ
ncbi:MAG TPA: hypothetical protein VN947_11545 [Polyangia bacterium]|nr:hypothetical protein [Polyangia bacterium]